VFLKEQEQAVAPQNQQGDHPIYKIVITGGPCAGKTTCMNRIKENLT